MINSLAFITNRSIIDRTWHVLIVMAFSRLPSDDLLPYIEYYIQSADNTLNKQLPIYCLHILQVCKSNGPIVEMPSDLILQELLVRNGLPIVSEMKMLICRTTRNIH